MANINPKWLSYNNSMNEGGEGYNPHPKFIASVSAPAAGATRYIDGKWRTQADATRFAKAALVGAEKAAFLARVAAAFEA